MPQFHSRSSKPDRTVACATDHRYGPCPLTSKRCACHCHEGDWIQKQSPTANQGALFLMSEVV